MRRLSRLPPRSVLLSIRSEVATGNPHPLAENIGNTVGENCVRPPEIVRYKLTDNSQKSRPG